MFAAAMRRARVWSSTVTAVGRDGQKAGNSLTECALPSKPL